VLISYDPALISYLGFVDAVGGTVVTPTADSVLVSYGDITENLVTIGTFNFTSLSSTGTAEIGIGDGNGLYSFIGNQNEYFPDYFPASITIVPLPGALWLMLSGLGLLGLARRKA
jgi:hypothetical protein